MARSVAAIALLLLACAPSKTERQASSPPPATASVAAVPDQPPPIIESASPTPPATPPSKSEMAEERAARLKREHDEACKRAHVKGVPCEEEEDRTQASIEHAIVSARPNMRACYNDALKTQPTLQVMLRFTIVVAKDGSVKSLIDAGSTRTDPQVSACVQQVLRALVFAPSGNETTVTIPLKFAPPSP